MGRDIGGLHDATLIGIRFEWRSGRLWFDIRTGDARSPVVRIEGRNVTRVEIPREHPWGPSVSINGVTLRQERPSTRLEIEMQSGDVLVAVGEAFSQHSIPTISWPS